MHSPDDTDAPQRWDEFRVVTTPRLPRGTIAMHPDDAARMRSPSQLAASLAIDKRHRGSDDLRRPHMDRYDDGAAREHNLELLEELRRRRGG